MTMIDDCVIQLATSTPAAGLEAWYRLAAEIRGRAEQRWTVEELEAASFGLHPDQQY